MKFCILILFITLIIHAFAQNQSASIDTVTKHVYYLASEELKGRNTGEEGQKLAAKYIANRFEAYGLESYNKKGYYHYYNLKRLQASHIKVKGGGNILIWPWHFYYVSGFHHIDTVEAELAFVGYGSEKELNSLELKNKAIALIADAPQDAYARIKEIASKYNNTTFFVIFSKRSKIVDKEWANHLQMSKFDLPYKFENRKLQLLNEEWADNKDSLNVFYCFPNVLRNILMLDDSELEKIAKDNLNKNNELLSGIATPQITCYVNYNDTVESIQVENVGGFIQGKDTTKTVVVSAHYDHIGVEMGNINYGADDNASGTSVLLESARLMAKDARNGIKPKTNVLFLAFSGEEKGMLGSKAYVRDSTVNLEEIKLNINMDMVGRWDKKHENDKDFVYLLAAGDQSKDLYKIGKRQIKVPKSFTLSNKPDGHQKMVFKYGSDHYSFLEKNISVVVFFTGLHDDYHTPRDTPDKINYQNLTNITNVVYQYVYKAAELE